MKTTEELTADQVRILDAVYLESRTDDSCWYLALFCYDKTGTRHYCIERAKGRIRDRVLGHQLTVVNRNWHNVRAYGKRVEHKGREYLRATRYMRAIATGQASEGFEERWRLDPSKLALPMLSQNVPPLWQLLIHSRETVLSSVKPAPIPTTEEEDYDPDDGKTYDADNRSLDELMEGMVGMSGKKRKRRRKEKDNATHAKVVARHGRFTFTSNR